MGYLDDTTTSNETWIILYFRYPDQKISGKGNPSEVTFIICTTKDTVDMRMFLRLSGYDGDFHEPCQKLHNEGPCYFYKLHLTLWMNLDIWYKFCVPRILTDRKWENLHTFRYTQKTHGNRSLSVDQKKIIVYVISDFEYNINLHESCCAILRFIRQQCTSVDELLQCLMHFERYTLMDKRTECLTAFKLVCMLYIYIIVLVHPEKAL